MLRFIFYLSIGICLFCHLPGKAQISHGGQPLPFSLLKSSEDDLFVELPAFDLTEQLRIDSLESTDFQNGYHFAYKFMTDYTPANSGIHFTLPDGTKVWRLGIRSLGAFSLNFLFSTYRLPKGSRLFLYNREQSDVRGAFNHLNNSELNLLPVAPIEGDEIIIEYQEPANAAFPGELVIGEVNHAYRDFQLSSPQPDRSDFGCMPVVACFQDTTKRYDDIERSVVLLIVNGNVGCTGTLVNNTANDGKPYILTASHCLNDQFTISNPDYVAMANSIICYFNYNSPQCKPVEPGHTSQTLASAYSRAVNEPTDMALIEMLDLPPADYNAYYAGWNVQDAGLPPYTCIHHPMGSPKRINVAEEDIELQTYPFHLLFDQKVHWRINRWTIGCTAGGSSGSPLFDASHHVLGGLTGGKSECAHPVNDYFFAIHPCWSEPADSSQQLKCWLDPINSGKLLCEGLEPNKWLIANETLSLDNDIRCSADDGYIHIWLPAAVTSATCTLYTLDGKAVRQNTMNGVQGELETGTLPAGMYILRITSQEKCYTQKILL